MEALRPIIPAAGRGRVNQLKRRGAVRSRTFLVKVNDYARNQRFPASLEQELRIVERPGGGINNVPANAAGFTGDIRRLSELKEAVLTGESLPSFCQHPRGVDAAG